MTRRSLPVSRPNSNPTRQTLARAARTMAPALVALAFAGAAHAQGTMDFSGATTLMGSFKTFASLRRGSPDIPVSLTTALERLPQLASTRPG